MPEPKTVKMNLKRAYTYHGKDYGPGSADVPESIVVGRHPDGSLDELRPADDLKAREEDYQRHLNAGGEPVAPVTPSVANVTGEPENKTALPKPPTQPQVQGPSGAPVNTAKGAAVTPVHAPEAAPKK